MNHQAGGLQTAMYIPRNLLYTDSHLWLRQAGRMDAYIGITEYAQNELKFISSLNINSEGSVKKKGESFGRIYGEDRNFELIMPMQGRILLLNTEFIAKKPYMLNIDSYGFWLALVAFNDDRFSHDFLNAETYKVFIGQSAKIS